MRIFRFKLTAILMLFAAPHAFAQNQPTNFFAAPRDSASALIVATDPARVCSGVTFVHPETGVITTGTAGSPCLGNQAAMTSTCTVDGQKDCVIADDGKFSAFDAGSANSTLKSGNIRRGLTIGGVTGSYPSVATPMEPGSEPLGTSNVTKDNPQNFLLFGTDGTPYRFKVGKISDGDFVPAKNPAFFPSVQSTTSPTMLYMPFKISGAPNLSAENIIAPNTILSITGSSLPRSDFKPEAGITLTTVNNSQNTAIAKAIVFVDTPTQARWMLLKDTTTAAPRLSRTSSSATTLCSGAKVTINNNPYNSQTGVWALPSSKQVAWMLKTGATAPEGLIAKENLFSVGSTTIKFWVYDPPATNGTTGTYKTAYFTDILSDPVIESAGTNDTANVVCVFKLATAGGGSIGNAPPNPTNLVATTPAANSVALAWVSGGGTTVGYRVSYLKGQDAPSTCSDGTQVSLGSISGRTASITGLSAATIYSFRVCASDSSSTPLVSSGITVTATTSSGGGMVFTRKTDTGPVMIETFLPEASQDLLAAHVYLDPQNTRAFAYVFKSIENGAIAFLYPKYSAVTYANAVCGDLKNTLALMQTSILPTAFANYVWRPIGKTLVDAFAPGFTVAPFLGSVGDGKYPLGQNFLAVDDTDSINAQFKVYQFSTAGGPASETNATAGAVICTAGP